MEQAWEFKEDANREAVLARAYRVKGDSTAAEREAEAYLKLLRTQQGPK